MTPIDIIADFIYVRSLGEEQLRAECNYCGAGGSRTAIFYEGEDWRMTDSGWLKDATLHVLNVHADELEHYDTD